MSGSIRIQPGRLSGTIVAPPSKSCAHRAVIAASLAKGESRITNLELSQDIEATIGAMRSLGADIRLELAGSGRLDAAVRGIEAPAGIPSIDCGESGSTLRFLIPVALTVAGGAVFTGSERLGSRPLGPYSDIFARQGLRFEYSSGGFPLTVSGGLRPGEFLIPGNISSQFITGLMFTLPLLDCDSSIVVEGILESRGYVDITMDVLETFGVAVKEIRPGGLYHIEGNQRYRAVPYAVEGDWSQAAFLLVMGLLGGPVTISGLNPQSSQGDRAIMELFRKMGGDIRWEAGRMVVHQSRLCACAVDVSQCPDLTPAIAAAMAVAEGKSRITGGRRLRDKESDRLNAIASCLNGLGADVTETEDGLTIHGKKSLPGGTAQSHNDHRIAMMAASVSPACSGSVELEGHGAVAKSWPAFWEDFRGLGGRFS